MLPRELLVDIFSLALNRDGSRVTEEMSRTRFRLRSLRFFMTVCKYWRDVILHTKIIWREAQFGDGVPRELTQLMLERSGQAPLHLTICLKNVRPERRTEGLDVQMLETSMHRVSRLNLRLLHLGGKRLEQMYDLPDLQELVVEVKENVNPLFFIPVVSPDCPLARLQTLHSSYVAFNHITPFFRPTLRSFHMDSTPYGISAPVDGFLQALSAMPLLEDLSLDWIFHDNEPLATQLPLVRLESLKKIHFDIDRYRCAEILEHLVFPASVILSGQFDCTVTYVSERTRVEYSLAHKRFLAAVFAKLVGDGVIGDMPRIDTLKLAVSSSEYRAEMAFLHHSREVHVPLFLGINTDGVLAAGELVDLICNVAPRSIITNLRNLSILSGILADRRLSAGFLNNAPKFVNLVALHLDGTYGIWQCLVSLHEIYERRDISPPPLPFPCLQVLTVTACIFRTFHKGRELIDYPSDFLFSLRGILQTRKTIGLPLRKLGIYQSRRFAEKDAEMLREFVEVDWDGVVDLEAKYRQTRVNVW